MNPEFETAPDRPSTSAPPARRYFRPQWRGESPTTDALLVCLLVYGLALLASNVFATLQPIRYAFVAGQLLLCFALSILALWRLSPSFVVQRLACTDLARSAFIGFQHAVFSFPVVIGISGLLNFVVRDRELHPALTDVQTMDAGTIALVGLSAVVAAPLAEELLFRGLVLSWLAARIPPWGAVLLSSLLFGLAHFPLWPDPIPLTFFGVVLGLSYVHTQSLWTPIFLHAAFNAANIAVSWALFHPP